MRGAGKRERERQNMKQQPENGKADIKSLSDEDLKKLATVLNHWTIESELFVRRGKLTRALWQEELEFRQSKKPRRPEEEWDQLWVQHVNDVAEAYGLSLKDVWEMASKIMLEEKRMLSQREILG